MSTIKFREVHTGILVWAMISAVGLGAAISSIVSAIPAPPVTPPSLTVHVDLETSCEYLVTAQGGIVPRMHLDGYQVCAGEDELAARLPELTHD